MRFGPGTDVLGSRSMIGRHLLDVDALGRDGIELMLDEAEKFRDPKTGRAVGSDSLRGRTVINLFYEASTRTRVSFEIAARKLGAEVVNISPSGSSVTKGESLVDTVRTLEALGVDALVMRHSEAGAPYLVARHFEGSVINAGDGQHAHPTQALLDTLTIRQTFGKIQGLRVAIIGDILHSRVARSTAIALALCGANVVFCGPRTLLPPDSWLELFPRSDLGGSTSQTTSLAEAALGADVLMALRIQKERMAGGLLPSLKEYSRGYGLSQLRVAELAPNAMVMHPGPVNEGVELDPDLITADRSLIAHQVANGVLVRMAVLNLLLGGDCE